MDDLLPKLIEMYEDTPVLVALYDGFDRLRYANRAFRSAYFLEPGEEPLWPDLMRRNHKAGRGTVIEAEDFEAWLIATQSRRGKTGFRALETDLVDGRWLWMTETVSSDGWMLCVASDITGLRVDERAARKDRDLAIKVAHTDELTGIANRRFVMARAQDMLRLKSAETGVRGCFCLLDIDNFKGINDSYGHQAGDMVLCDFARRLHDLLRRTDCLGRVGGEEFVLVLPDTPPEEAVLIVERMLVVIRRSRPLANHAEFSYTFSAGIAVAEAGDSSAKDLYARADRALYTAKTSGRNCIHLYHSTPDQSSAAG